MIAEEIIWNGQLLADPEKATLHEIGALPGPGRYWYDRHCGAWGREGEAVSGFIQPGLEIGGHMSAKASDGASGVFINGRELPRSEAQYLSRVLGGMVRGRYFLDRNGNAGMEGGPALANLFELAHNRARIEQAPQIYYPPK